MVEGFAISGYEYEVLSRFNFSVSIFYILDQSVYRWTVVPILL